MSSRTYRAKGSTFEMVVRRGKVLTDALRRMERLPKFITLKFNYNYAQITVASHEKSS